MRKNLLSILILACIILVVSSSGVNAAQEVGNNRFKVYYPEIVSVFEPFNVKVMFLDTEIAKQYKYVEVLGPGCTIPFAYQIGVKNYPYEVMRESSFHRIPYDGEKELNLVLAVAAGNGQVPDEPYCVIRMSEESDYVSPQYDPANRAVWNNLMRVEFDIDYHEYDVGILETPEGFIKSTQQKDEYLRKNLQSAIYEKKTGTERVWLQTELINLKAYEMGKYYTYAELLDKDEMMEHLRGGNNIKNKPHKQYEELNVQGQKGFMHYGCYRTILGEDETYGGTEVFETECSYIGLIIKEFGALQVLGYGETLTTLEAEADIPLKEEEWKHIMTAALQNTYFTSDGKSVEVVIKESNDDYCGDCKQGYVCGACGNCIKETKAINPSQVQITTNVEIKNNNTKILNAIESNVALSIYPNIKISYQGKSVDYCDLQEPGLTMNIRGEVSGDDPYSGFTSGFVTDKRERVYECAIDFTEKNPRCVFIISPNSKKKFFADAKDIIEEYDFKLTIGNKREEKTARITLIPPKNFDMQLRSKNNQVQQGSAGVLEITPRGGTTKAVIVKASLLGPGKIGKSSDSINTNWLLTTVDQGKTVKIGYQAPPLGNFDIGKELASLSMTKLQTDAAKQIALDAVTAYGGEYAGNIEALVEAGEYSSKIGHLTDTFKVVNGMRNIKGTDKAIQDITGEVGDAMQVTDGKQDATWAENAADAGIVGISVAQTAVGVLTFIPNKIPGVNKLTAGLQTAFSAATNIWKANLQYISKSEKIERAKELFYPAVIAVTAQDISGWTTQELFVFQIAYHEIK
jgi:hypothetical protein